MGWYTVTKRINGRSYLYLQMTYRVGGKVKTKNKYLGPANGSARSFASGPSHIPTASEYPKVERPSGGLKISKIKRLKPHTRAYINKHAAKRRLEEEITNIHEQLKEEHIRSTPQLRELKSAYKKIYRKNFKLSSKKG